MTTIISTTQSVGINDLMLLSFHKLRETVHQGIKEQIDKNSSGCLKEVEALEAFNQQVCHEESVLRDGKVKPLPTQEELETKKQIFLKRLKEFKTSYNKLKEIAANIQKGINFLNPGKKIQAEEQEFEECSPELHLQIKRFEDICLTYVQTLSASLSSFTSLATRMCKTLNGKELTGSLQSFCVIVDNKGQPLSWLSQGFGYVWPSSKETPPTDSKPTEPKTNTQLVEITDPMLLSFHNLRKTAYQGTKEQIKTNCLACLDNAETLETFYKKVRGEGSALQNEKVNPLPAQEELEAIRQIFLKQFKEFKTSYRRLKEIETNIERAVNFLKPGEEQEFKECSPELYLQIKSSNRTCLTYAQKLGASHLSFTNLAMRMHAMLYGKDLPWSLQRFCAIVDNNGRPLHFLTKSINFVTRAAVPEAKEVSHRDSTPISKSQTQAEKSVEFNTEKEQTIYIDTTESPSIANTIDNADSTLKEKNKSVATVAVITLPSTTKPQSPSNVNTTKTMTSKNQKTKLTQAVHAAHNSGNTKTDN